MVHKSKTEEYLFIHSESTISSEMRFLKSNQPDGDFQILQARIPHLEYAADHFGEFFWIKTNENAQNFKLVKTPVSNTEKENWVDVITHRSAVLLEDFDLFSRYLVTQERSNGLTQIQIKPWDRDGHALKFDDDTYTAWIGINPEFDTDILRYGYNSLVTPSSVYDYNMITGERTLLKQQEVVGDMIRIITILSEFGQKHQMRPWFRFRWCTENLFLSKMAKVHSSSIPMAPTALAWMPTFQVID